MWQVVREGRPCHLYFDLEYVPECNPDVKGDMMVALLLDLVRQGLQCAHSNPTPAVPYGAAEAHALPQPPCVCCTKRSCSVLVCMPVCCGTATTDIGAPL